MSKATPIMSKATAKAELTKAEEAGSGETSPGSTNSFAQVTKGALLSAAISGLLLGAGCSGSDSEGDAQNGATSQPVVLSEMEDKSMTFDRFVAECAAREGLVQTHAVCFGNNSCRGVSFNKYDFVLTEHTCKAMNTCGGMSCVELPKDQGRTGQSIYQADGGCNGCHGGEKFTLFVRKGVDLQKAMADFPARDNQHLAAIVAFGVTGYGANGVAEAFMPAHHEEYSLAEIVRTVEYLKTLPIAGEEYGVLGVDEDVHPE